MTESGYVFFAKNGTSLPLPLMLPPYSGAERVAPSRTMAAISPVE